MRMPDKVDRDSQKKSVGEISDQHEQPQDERKAVRMRTFTRWMNVFLKRCDPPVAVHDLFTDIQDGRILMTLLEELSGCKLLYRFRSSPHRIFRLNNISKALAFLDDRHVKLLGIDASGIADGIPSVVLNLVWNIVLYFQVKEATRGLQRHLSSSLSSLSMSSYPSSSDLSPYSDDIGSYFCNTLPSKGRQAAREPKYHGKAIKTLLQWVQRCTSKYGVDVHDFGKSWRSGLAFLAVIKSINPALVDLRESMCREPRENLQLAFMVAHYSLDIPPLLEPEDVLCTSPDEQSIITYVSMFLRRCSGIDGDLTLDVEGPSIPNFGSLESVSFGQTPADDPEVQALLKGFEQSSEQRLWKEWARRRSRSHSTTSLHSIGAVTSDFSSSSSDIFASCHSQGITEKPVSCTTTFDKKKSRSQSILKPPSPLDAVVVNQDIRSWMEKASRVDESHLSLSSEEGIYSLSALDSDEEEAYSYILDLNKEVFQSLNQSKGKVQRVEEETAEEMSLHGQQTEESKHLEVAEILNGNGCKYQEGSLAQNIESEVRAQSDWDKNKSSSREITNNMDVEEESRSRKEREEERAVRAQSNDDGDYSEEERKQETADNARLVTSGYDKTGALVDETKKTELFEMAHWKGEEKRERGLFEKLTNLSTQVSDKRVADNEQEEANLMTFQQRQAGMLGREEEEDLEIVGEVLYDVRRKNEEKIKGVNAPKMEDFTSKHEDEEEYNDKIKTNVEEKDGEHMVKRRKLTDKRASLIDKPVEMTHRSDTNGRSNIHNGDSWTPACSGASQKYCRQEGFILQSSAASCDITPLELEILLFLWILLYCSFIIPQMSL